MTPSNPETLSPFHAGERTLQARAGKQDTVDAFARKVIRPYMPDQHRAFFAQLPFLVLGSVDKAGWPWASLISGHPGFATSPDPKQLSITGHPVAGDPLASGLKAGAPIGVLGIELPTRRRNRMNARVISSEGGVITLGVDQSFGNCPQYIQTRAIEFVRDPAAPLPHTASETFTTLDDKTRAFIAGADTFFVASAAPLKDNPTAEGVDVSHRGGRAGFIKVERDTLTIPDYAGNYHFNTLGNFLLNPKAGLIFPDFASGDVVMLTGTVELIWEDAAEVRAFEGAERAWRFTLDHGVRLGDALPFRARFGEWSPNSLIAGTWAGAEQLMAAEARRAEWHPFRIARIVDESSVIRSFHLEPADGTAPASFAAGQFLTLRVVPDGLNKPLVRTFTVSSAPGAGRYRISVKREGTGGASAYLHDRMSVGDIVEVKAPKGAFVIDPAETRPAVLIAGGVGITPMISMAQHVVNEGIRTRHTRPLTVIHAARTMAERAFAPDLRALVAQSCGAMRYISILSAPEKDARLGSDFDRRGRVDADLLRRVLALDDYDVFVCGPEGFTQDIHDALRQLGVQDARIFAEAFGPSPLNRQAENRHAENSSAAEGAGTPKGQEADASLVRFAASGFEQRWKAGDGSLLELAEAQGLSPDFSCRVGNCGSCATRKIAGEVTYRTTPTFAADAGEVLICCAVPAKGSGDVVLDL